MGTVTVSPKFQVVIPKEAREALHLRPGAKVEVFPYNNRIEFVPVKSISKLRGYLKGIDTTVIRDKAKDQENHSTGYRFIVAAACLPSTLAHVLDGKRREQSSDLEMAPADSCQC